MYSSKLQIRTFVDARNVGCLRRYRLDLLDVRLSFNGPTVAEIAVSLNVGYWQIVLQKYFEHLGGKH